MALLGQLRDERVDVVAHEEHLVSATTVDGMHRHLGLRQPEDQPAVTDVNMWKLQDVEQKRFRSWFVIEQRFLQQRVA